MCIRSVVGWALVVAFGSVGVAMATESDQQSVAAGTGAGSDPYAARLLKDRQEAAREAEARQKRDREERQTPEARAERRASRTRFQRMSAEDARALAREKLSGHVTAKPFRPLQDLNIVRIDAANSATVQVDGERRKLLASGPLAVPADDGQVVPLDLSLRAGDNGFRSARPAVAVTLPSNLGDTAKLGSDDVGLRAVSGSGAASGAIVEGGVIYANSHTDTDTALRPTPGGFELYDVLRSEDSPEELRYRVEGAGLSLRPEPGGGFAVLRDDQPVARIGAVVAFDADETHVQTEATVVDSRTIAIAVSHRQEDLRYPIIVDPPVEKYDWHEGYTRFDGWSTNSWGGWGFKQGYQWWGNGLYIHEANHVDQWINYHDWARWEYRTPRDTIGIKDVHAHWVISNNPLGPVPCTELGLLGSNVGPWARRCDVVHDAVMESSAGSGWANVAAFGTWAPTSAWRRFGHKAGYIQMTLDDAALPHTLRLLADSGRKAGGWTTSSYATAEAKDDGFGVKRIKLGDVTVRDHTTCDGTRRGTTCPLTESGGRYLSQGINKPVIEAWDAAWKPASAPSERRVDSDGPSLDEPRGDLYTRRDQVVLAPATVSITARDGVPLGTDAERRTGVQRVEVYLRRPGEKGIGTLQGPTPTQGFACTPDGTTSSDSCPMTRTYTFPTEDDNYPSGEYKLTYKAFDQLSNESVARSFTFSKGDIRDPVLAAPVHEPVDRPTDWIRHHEGQVTAAATDIGYGLARIDWTEPNEGSNATTSEHFTAPNSTEPCQGTVASPCPPAGSKTFPPPPPDDRKYNTDRYRQGIVRSTLQAFDASGKASNRQAYDLKIDREAPTITLGGRLHDDFAGRALPDAGTYRLETSARDGIDNGEPEDQRSGVVSLEIKLKGPGDEEYLRVANVTPACARQDSCSATLAYDFSTDGRPDGRYDLIITAIDELGHVRNAEFAFIQDTAPPTITSYEHLDVPVGWTRDARPVVHGAAEDLGVGMRELALRSSRGWNGPTEELSCAGTVADPCPRDLRAVDEDLRYDVETIPFEGRVPIDFVATDALGKATTRSGEVRIDRSGPAVELSGALYEGRDEGIEPGLHELVVQATDGSSGSATDERSGVRSVVVLVDGDVVHSEPEQACPDSSCSMTARWSLDTEDYIGRRPEVTVRAIDQVGNATVTHFEVWRGDEHASIPLDEQQDIPEDEPDAPTFSARAVPPSPGDPNGLRFGISDNKASVFRDRRLVGSPNVVGLDLQDARLTVEYDVVSAALGGKCEASPQREQCYATEKPGAVTGATKVDRQNDADNRLARVDAWMNRVCPTVNGTRQCRLRPLVSFDADRFNLDDVPLVQFFRIGTRAFLARYPYVSEYTAWDEPNCCKGTERDPQRVAEYFNDLAAQCDATGCTVVAGDFLEDRNLNVTTRGYPVRSDGTDTPGAPQRTYFDVYLSTLARTPAAWAIHPYSAANFQRRGLVSRFVRATQNDPSAPLNSPGPDIWFSEVGGLYRLGGAIFPRCDNDPVTTLQDCDALSPDRGATALRYMLGNEQSGNEGLVNRFPRVSRFYYYNWLGFEDFDAGLVSYRAGSPLRKTYFCFRLITNPQPNDAAACE